MRSWVEERKLPIFDNVVIVTGLATIVICLAAVLFAVLALPGTRVFVSLIFLLCPNSTSRLQACRLIPTSFIVPSHLYAFYLRLDVHFLASVFFTYFPNFWPRRILNYKI